MARIALLTIGAWLAIVAVARGIVRARATGDPGLRLDDRPGSAQSLARVLGVGAFGALVAAPIADLAGLRPLPVLGWRVVRLAGLGLATAGIGGTVVAQAAMGDAWRGDVDPDARTALVTTGPFARVRNPVLLATSVTVAGIALMVPNRLAAAAVGLQVLSATVLVRLVEEPYLERVHGDAYRSYVARTGRFLPRRRAR